MNETLFDDFYQYDWSKRRFLTWNFQFLCFQGVNSIWKRAAFLHFGHIFLCFYLQYLITIISICLYRKIEKWKMEKLLIDSDDEWKPWKETEAKNKISSSVCCVIHCSDSTETLRKLQSHNFWIFLLIAAKIRNYQTILDLEPNSLKAKYQIFFTTIDVEAFSC